MKITITGGTGFIGSRLALRSREMGHDVTILGQVNTPAEEDNLNELKAGNIRVLIGAVTDREKTQEAVADADIVFHLAAAQHEANVPDQHFRDVNVEGTRQLIEASIESGVKRFVYGSTIGVYGSALDGQIDEQSLQRPDNIYGITKAEAEKLVQEYADRIPATIIRISETYGPGDRRLLKLFKAIKKRVFFMIGKGLNKHQLIYVDDLIDGLYVAALSDTAIGETFVLAGSEVLTTNEMARAISGAVNTPVRNFRAPLWFFMLTAIILETLLKPLGIQPPLHRRRMDFFRKSFYFSRDKVEHKLGFEPKTSFEDGTKLTAEWYRKNKLL
ncbi:MAG: NAD(P)-dependent oxidoreductase [Gammaproteobacteria bacterium]|nr:MAG: NAD(P)-dependent oxidoreductase [Gammaproteobacteria bacterium]